MTTSNNKAKVERRWTGRALFAALWAAVILLSLIVAVVGMQFTGGPTAFREWLDSIFLYGLIWRVLVCLIGGSLYLHRYRPRLRAMQRKQWDGGEESHARLIKIEGLLVFVVVANEVANLPGLLDWFRA